MNAWRQVQEKGSLWGMSVTLAIYRFLGRWAADPVLWGVVAYFFLSDAVIRRASRDYLRRVMPSVTAWTVYRHLLSFAQTSLDRFDIWTNRPYTYHYYGEENVLKMRDAGRGAVLIGAHMGNFDVLRVLGKRRKGRVRILTDRRNSQMFSELLKRFYPGMEEGLLEQDPQSADGVFEIKKRIEEGELIGLLGDRTFSESPRGARRVSRVPFLGDLAAFPQSPFIFAQHMGCPVLLLFGLRRSAGVYDLYVEPFAERIEWDEESREAALKRYSEAYARRLEHYCRLYPLQWFNFYDFWRS